jgi:hypothetical protein
MSNHELILEVQGLLGRTLKSTQSPRERELFSVAAAALRFISETGSIYPFEDYLQRRGEAPPYAVASFKTREEADSWLQQHPEPPHGAFVLVADSYHIVMYVRELNDRRLFPHPILESYLHQLKREVPDGKVNAYGTREEGVAWLQAQPGPPQRAYLLIDGRLHVALYHGNLRHYALHALPA